MFNWIKKNKGAIVFVLSSITSLCGWLIPEFGDLWIVCGYKALPILMTAASTLLGMMTMPLTKASTQEAIDSALVAIKGSKATPEDKEKAKDIKYFKNEIALFEKDLKVLEKENAKVVEDYNRAVKYGLSISHDLRKSYEDYVNAKAAREKAKQELEQKLALLEK